MNPEEIGAAVVAKKMTIADGIAALEKLGYEKQDAREQLFFALGGDDVVADEAQRLENLEIDRLDARMIREAREADRGKRRFTVNKLRAQRGLASI